MLPVAIYLRISHDPHHARAGVGRQRADCETLAAQRFPGHPIVTYTDNDKSAYSGRLRPAYRDLTTAISARQLHAVIAWDQDRLLRLPRELEALIDLCERVNFQNLLTAKSDLDLTTHDGQLQARIMAAVAKKSSDDTGRRVSRAARDRRERGLWPGRAPYGYIHAGGSQLELVPSRAELVRIAFSTLREGGALNQLVRELSPLDPLAPQDAVSWRHCVLSPAHAGLNRAGIRGTWAPIITPAEHADIVALFADPARRVTRTGHRVHWLSGVMTCHLCHGLLRVTNLNYTCKTCFHTSISVAGAEEAIAEMLAEVVSNRAPAATPEPVDQGAAAGGGRLAELAAMYAAGEITREEWVAARATQVVPASPLRSSTATPTVPEDLRSAWATLSVDHQHAIARRYLHRVEVGPSVANRFDAERLRPEWRE